MIANDIYDALTALAASNSLHIQLRYNRLGDQLQLFLKSETQGRGEFSGLFARLIFLCQRHGIKHDHYLRLNALRRRVQNLSTTAEHELRAAWRDDMLAFTEFVAMVSQQPVPSQLTAALPNQYSAPAEKPTATNTTMRVVVDTVSQTSFQAFNHNGDKVSVCYDDPKFSHLKPLLHHGTQLNIVAPSALNNQLHPDLIIYEPDYLVNITTVAACFAPYATTPMAPILKRFEQIDRNKAILLGDFSGQLLDEEVYSNGVDKNYKDSVGDFFRNFPVDLAACSDLGGFHDDAKNLQNNIRQALRCDLCKDPKYNKDRVILEPSFTCETLGLQGRMDLITDDFNLLIEQKSGKRDEYHGNSHQTQHYVQMLLYLAVLHYGFGKRQADVSCYLYYSKYPDGLIHETPASNILAKAIEMRNGVVSLDMRLAQGHAKELLDTLTPEELNTNLDENGSFWSNYISKQLHAILDPIHHASPLAKTYFYNFLGFVAREQQLAKIGSPGHDDNGFASLWNSSVEEKVADGTMLKGLTIASLQHNDMGVCSLTFNVPQPSTGEDITMPRFRLSDIVMLYSYLPNQQPDARRSIVFHTTLTSIKDGQIVLTLRQPQRNNTLFDKSRLWAVEQDYMESTGSALFHHVHSILTATTQRQQLLLFQRQPMVDTSQKLIGNYGDFNTLVLRSKQARDCFLVMGPPGTGKTSFGIMNILREELLASGTSVLLLSYTNRAVDEICSKLVAADIDFIRLGNGNSTPTEYQPFMLKNRVGGMQSANEVCALIEQTRVFVSTTHSAASSHAIFKLKRFSLAIIDEASQILEPHLLAILCATYGGQDCVQRFVMIGDHKQLPAVVQQSDSASNVADPLLHDIGLTNCRNSLFERFYRRFDNTANGDNPYIYNLIRQGRMHSQVAEFSNKTFYGNMLHIAGLSHQSADIAMHTNSDNHLRQLLTQHRAIFFDCPANGCDQSVPPKVNDAEADLIANIAHQVYLLYAENGRDFLPTDTLGIIVPYRHQISNIYRRLQQYGIEQLANITIDTVERFQGSQRDVIIYGFTVRQTYQLNFLQGSRFNDGDTIIDRKLNVALTRAKEQNLIVGNQHLIQADPLFKSLIQSCYFANTI